MNRNGESQLVAENIAFYETSQDRRTVHYMFSKQYETFILKEFNPNGEMIRKDIIEIEDVFAYDMNSTMDIILFDKVASKNDDDKKEDEWRDIYI